MKKAFFQIVVGLTFLATSVFAEEFKCTGQEKGINTMTGAERTIPIFYHIEINNNNATIDGIDNINFTVTEDDDTYILKASIGKSRLLGEYDLQIDKHTGFFKGKSWLFSRDNIVTKEGKCEKCEDNEKPNK
ncbi:exported hypothetical protein [uncultured Desulfobacterium sp.]|uniref:C-type lysozyme inhibitor domain-containing protein n=1 Tax=uncultured Desulfobacterium sp. TaxID=201089 RepID=A0A445MV46_9BACT|nr:exported hypothetical protein [uncultured Desulfobacterium sp.]